MATDQSSLRDRIFTGDEDKLTVNVDQLSEKGKRAFEQAQMDLIKIETEERREKRQKERSDGVSFMKKSAKHSPSPEFPKKTTDFTHFSLKLAAPHLKLEMRMGCEALSSSGS